MDKYYYLYLCPSKDLVVDMKHLTVEQRYTIFVLKSQGCTQKKIADIIGVHKSTISRELSRNSDRRNGSYKWELADRKCRFRHSQKPKHQKFTANVKDYVDSLLINDYSPEQIVGVSVLNGIECVSHERIYQYVWKNKKQGGTLYKHLRRQGRKYRKRGALKDTRGIIVGRVDISQRPKIVDEKTRLGDLEIDTIIGKNHKQAIVTIIDRKSGFLWMGKLENKEATPLSEKVIELLKPHKQWLHTITADNGKEFAKHQKIAEELNISLYFARPYHAWERGANENTNGLIRQYFKKKEAFQEIGKEQIENVMNKINNRPRKRLGFLTPNQFLLVNLKKQNVAFMN